MRAGDFYSILVVGPILVSLFLALAVGCGASGAMGSAGQDNSVVTDPMMNSNVSEPEGNDNNPVNEPQNDNSSTDTDSFENAIQVALTDGVIQINGEIADAGDIDIYDIGPVFAGEKITLDVRAQSGDLNPNAAIFGEEENLLYANNDRAYYAGDLDPKIIMTFRHDMDHCYVAVSSYFSSGTSGSYLASIEVVEGELPEPKSDQYVYLNYDGAASVSIGTQAAIAIPTFEQSAVALSFDDDIDYIIERVTELVREDYIGTNITILSSRENAKPSGEYTTIHFGSYNENLLGLADNVDEYNEDYSQQAVVFVDTFEVFLQLHPTADEMAQALANVASHEAGHLLGLQHSHDSSGIMDTSASLNRMLLQQAFNDSVLDAWVFPTGRQDAPQLLVDAVGGDVETIRSNSMMQLNTIQSMRQSLGGAPARDTTLFGTCLNHNCPRMRELLKKRAEQHETP